MAFKKWIEYIDEWGGLQRVETDFRPGHCDLCGWEIGKEDVFYVGFTRGNVMAFTCTKFNCTKWLETKAKVKDG